MPEWVIVMLVGSIGGLANAYLSEGGFSLPRFFADTQGRRLLDPGFIGGIPNRSDHRYRVLGPLQSGSQFL